MTGTGNPHPVENGFSFLSPYGVPYLPASGVKGVIRRAAEELALFGDESAWTIPLVWVLFGFEAGSAYLADGAGDWTDAFRSRCLERADTDPLLRAWLDAICPDRDRKAGEPERRPSEVLRSWHGSGKKAQAERRKIHWQGLLRFWDAFPSEEAELGLDILNPHHKKYYEGKKKGNDPEPTPHDAELPIPVFFLVLKPGAEFRFRVEAVDRSGLLGKVGDWRALLGGAFTHAFEWLGFGAKTAVGYGAMRNASRAVSGLGTGTSGGSTIESTQILWEEARLTYFPADGTGKITGPEGESAVVPREVLQVFRKSLTPDMEKRLKKRKGLSGLKALIRVEGNARIAVELKA